MRTEFLKSLLNCAEADPNLWLLTGDLGYTVLEPFAERFSSRFINVGVAEQNMVGIATGLARSGKKVFVYSIANFATLRCLEQIRNDMCYHGADVKIVSVGAGYSYGALGFTHHAIEDVGIMRSFPEMTVLSPGDPLEARLATEYLARHHGPGYLRLGKAGTQSLYPAEDISAITAAFESGITFQKGADLLILSTGMLGTAIALADKLRRANVSATVVSLPLLKPFADEAVIEQCRRHAAVITLEEHRRTGGLGDMVASRLVEFRGEMAPTTIPRLLRFAIPDTAEGIASGSRDYLLARAGLTPEAMARRIQTELPKLFNLSEN